LYLSFEYCNHYKHNSDKKKNLNLNDIKKELKGKKNPSNYVIMEMLSERYGWTPSQIKKESIQTILAYVEIISIKNSIEKENYKKIRK